MKIFKNLENGSVVEEGTHDKLMLKNGAYKKMYMSEIQLCFMLREDVVDD